MAEACAHVSDPGGANPRDAPCAYELIEQHVRDRRQQREVALALPNDRAQPRANGIRPSRAAPMSTLRPMGTYRSTASRIEMSLLIDATRRARASA